MHILIVGDPVDGFIYFGPFSSADEAIERAERCGIKGDWWTTPLVGLEAPAEKEGA
jgi:hypothetical protein